LFGTSIGFIIHDVSESTTENMSDGRSFEERVLARFDALDGRLNAIDGRLNVIDGGLNAVDRRLSSLETEAERRALETKPIWERALAEILDVKDHLSALEQASNQVSGKLMCSGRTC
jgi:hypothetical protein